MKGSSPLIGMSLLFAAGASFGQEPRAADEQERQRAEQDAAVAAADRRATGDFLTSMDRGRIRSDTLEGSNLLDAEGESIGDIDALLIDPQSGRVEALIVQVGGVAGIGERTVALSWDAVEVTRTDDESGVLANRYEVRTRMSQEQLEDAPEFEGPEDDQVFDDL